MIEIGRRRRNRPKHALKCENRQRKSYRGVLRLKFYTMCLIFLLVVNSLAPSSFNKTLRVGGGGGTGKGTSSGFLPWIKVASALSLSSNKATTEDDDDNSSSNTPAGRSTLRKGGKFGMSHPPKPTKTSNSTNKPTLNAILIKAGKRGIGGGIPGAIAGAVQVLSLMWLRTIINYQYRYGTSFMGAFRTLYHEGGVTRFYRGLWFALFQNPLSRFVSVAANDGVDALLSSFAYTRDWGFGRGTILASVIVGIMRIALMPLDTCKTVLQVDSVAGFKSLMRRVRAGNVHLLYQGAMAQAVSSIAAHYPWFFTYNTLNRSDLIQRVITRPLLRNAATGFVSSVVSDTITNSVRVIKTTKQAIASKHVVTYAETISMILAADGWRGLFGRGLLTRMMANGVQSIMFTVIWRGLANRFKRDEEESSAGNSDTAAATATAAGQANARKRQAVPPDGLPSRSSTGEGDGENDDNYMESK